jgi:hypothetical protein
MDQLSKFENSFDPDIMDIVGSGLEKGSARSKDASKNP